MTASAFHSIKRNLSVRTTGLRRPKNIALSSHRLDQRIKVLVDVEDYRKRRAERIVERAQAAAEAALDSGSEQELEPMDALERKIAHDAVAEIEGVSTESRGEDPDRYVVVLPD